MPDLIASDTGLTETQHRTLMILLNMIIPPDTEKGMPGAAEVDFIGYVIEFAPQRLNDIRRELDDLDKASVNHGGIAFPDMIETERHTLVDRLRTTAPTFAQNIVVQALSCYYQNDRVVTALGMEARPPFPKGNEVLQGDMSLLDPVRARGKLYRDA